MARVTRSSAACSLGWAGPGSSWLLCVPCIPLVTNTPVPSVPLVTDAPVASIPLVTDAPVPCIPVITDASVPSVPLVTNVPVPSLALVTGAPVPCIPVVPGLEMCNGSSAGCEGTLGLVGTRHQAQMRRGPREGTPFPPVHRGAMLRLACLEMCGCSCHPVANASVPWGQQRPLGTAAPLGDTEHPRRAWLSSPPGARVAPECTQPFGVPPLPMGVPKSPAAAWLWRDPGAPRRGGTGPWVPRRAGEDGGGCWRRMLLTQDLPKWFLFLRRGR